MKRFLFQLSLFSLLVLGAFFFVLSRADGTIDTFYLRFTTPQQESLIIGTSRAAQGLQPKVLNDVCQARLYNYAFTVSHSPFGETYFNSIKRKLKKGNTQGTFIVTVDPWSISSETADPNQAAEFRELDLCVANTKFVNANPNFAYLLNNLGGEYYKALSQKRSYWLLHDDGWLQIDIGMDPLQVEERRRKKIDLYRSERLPQYQFSSVRFEYLKKTIELLNDHGQVFLVRMPVHPEMLELEREFMPDFNDRIGELSSMCKGYLDMTPQGQKYEYTDCHHLYKSSGELVSREIGLWINKKR